MLRINKQTDRQIDRLESPTHADRILEDIADLSVQAADPYAHHISTWRR